MEAVSSLLTLTIILCYTAINTLCIDTTVIKVHQRQPSCPYVDDARKPSSEYGLMNCTWYSSNSCCRPTEVAAVFSRLLPLDTPDSMDATLVRLCRNMINYMICFFCDPEQYKWYNGSLQICEEFCVHVYSNCSLARYNGLTIGEEFKNGREFCESQRFEIVSGQENCFKFDPDVFTSAALPFTSAAPPFTSAALPFYADLALTLLFPAPMLVISLTRPLLSTDYARLKYS